MAELPRTDNPVILANYNSLDEVASCTEPLGIDGVYLNVYQNKDVLLGKEVILFVTGKYLGGDNSFDIGMPLERFTNEEQLRELKEAGAKLGWHTWTHRDLTTLSDEEIIRELTCPPEYGEFLAYPYGLYNDRVIAIAKELGFKDAWSVTQGTDKPFERVRTYL